MPRTETTTRNLFKFDELDYFAQQKALESCWDWNVGEDWWESTYEDAERIGLKITAFDIDRASYVKGDALWSGCEIANKIKEEHGETCDTYKLAATFLTDWDKLVEKHSDGVKLDTVAEENEYDFDEEADELEKEFLKDLKEEYRSILSKEYDYLTSEEAIKESIEANEVEFLEDGTQA